MIRRPNYLSKSSRLLLRIGLLKLKGKNREEILEIMKKRAKSKERVPVVSKIYHFLSGVTDREQLRQAHINWVKQFPGTKRDAKLRLRLGQQPLIAREVQAYRKETKARQIRECQRLLQHIPEVVSRDLLQRINLKKSTILAALKRKASRDNLYGLTSTSGIFQRLSELFELTVQGYDAHEISLKLNLTLEEFDQANSLVRETLVETNAVSRLSEIDYVIAAQRLKLLT
ncbi:MAG: hypothetical protein Q7S92_01035 [Candidatus Diapherotrites archaeon]|nr:hypothetical protein [Candidatus Diapherotrites archaeon]